MTTIGWRRRSGIQLAYPFEEKRLAKWEPPYIVQPKFDGERCRAVPVQNTYMLLSSEENVFYSVPHINKDIGRLRQTGYEFDGELYRHNTPFETISSIVSRTKNLHPEYETVKYHIFDIVSEDPQSARLVQLYMLEDEINSSKHLVMTPFWVVETFEELMQTYNEIIGWGYEGIIVRHALAPYVRKRSVYMMKFKPKKQDIYVITGVVEEVSKDGIPKDSLGALWCQGDDGTPFKVGTGFTQQQRKDLWRNIDKVVGRRVKVSYQHMTAGKRVPRFPVFMEVI